MYSLLSLSPAPAAVFAVIDWMGPVNAVIYGLIGIVLLLAGYFLFDFLTPRIHIQNELKANNTAVAIVIGALLLGIAYIIAHVVSA